MDVFLQGLKNFSQGIPRYHGHKNVRSQLLRLLTTKGHHQIILMFAGFPQHTDGKTKMQTYMLGHQQLLRKRDVAL